MTKESFFRVLQKRDLITHSEASRDAIAQQTEEFLREGGKIQCIPRGQGSRELPVYQNGQQKKYKAKSFVLNAQKYTTPYVNRN